MRLLGKASIGLIATLSIIALLATSADARVFRMTGNWVQQRGPNAQIPILGGINNAPNQIVTATGSAPATLTIPLGAFTGMNQLLLPLPVTTIVQLSTQFSFSGPGTLGSAGGPGVLEPGTKTTRPANFAFCPGAAANPNCTNPATGGTQGTKHGIVTYTAGPNQFGGTMNMLIVGTGSVSYVAGTSPTRIQHNLIGGGGGGSGLQVQGGAYAYTNTVVLTAGPITSGAVCASGPCAANGGIIVSPGVNTGGGGTTTTNFNTGFPWTTGMVSAVVTTKLPTTNSTLTGTGSDSRTDLGLGNVTLVAGGLLHRSPSNMHSSSLDSVTMTLKAKNLPSMSPSGLALLMGAILFGGYAARKSWSTRS